MQSHHRRVTQAKRRVDAAPPKALCCTKMRDRAKREQERNSSSDKKGGLQLTKNVTQIVNRPGMTTTKGKSLHVAGGTFTVSNGPPATILPLLDSCSLEVEGGVGRWHLYHTHTGRLTGFLRERQRLSSRRGQDKRHLQPPWRPPYTSPARTPLAGAIETKHQGNLAHTGPLAKGAMQRSKQQVKRGWMCRRQK
ncbi:hypothetical protein GBAR_LOCUS428 [Geodia barretti]|nr:hypothetical protein GBAR_LOCUS428 [Geodia barretti]